MADEFITEDGFSQIKAALSMCTEERGVRRAILSTISRLNEGEIYSCGHGRGCNGDCIRRLLVKHLRMAGFDAGLCKVEWKSSEKVMRGSYEFIDVLLLSNEQQERLIIDIDFQSQFSIARPVEEYTAIVNLIPLLFVGKLGKLEEILEFISEEGISSFRRSGLHVPPWRMLEYMRAKWFSACRRITCLGDLSREREIGKQVCWGDEYCKELLQQLKALKL